MAGEAMSEQDEAREVDHRVAPFEPATHGFEIAHIARDPFVFETLRGDLSGSARAAGSAPLGRIRRGVGSPAIR